MCFETMIAIFKDIAVAVAAIIGAFVAFRGLNTWQRQLVGQAEYELSRRILVSLLRYRDAIDEARDPVLGDEAPGIPVEKAKGLNEAQIFFDTSLRKYQSRWNKVQKQRAALHPDLLEAEALWGQELNVLFKELFGMQSDLFTQIRRYLEYINPKTFERRREKIFNAEEKVYDTIYDTSSEETPDEFKAAMLNTIECIENHIKVKLKSRSL